MIQISKPSDASCWNWILYCCVWYGNYL